MQALDFNHLPADIDEAAFDALQDDPACWRAAIQALADAHGGGGPLVQAGGGTVLVALLGSDRVLKLYPPCLAAHHAVEAAALPALHGRLAVPTPALLAAGRHQGWPWLLMGQLHGTLLTQAWPTLPEAGKCALLAELGALCAQLQALPLPGAVAALVPAVLPAWPDFIATRRQQCLGRQQRTGLPAHLLAQVEAFIAGPLPEDSLGAEPPVLLTGEFTPMNLLVQPAAPQRLAGMFDFGDCMVGHRACDWLGPLCFLAAGRPARCRAFYSGLGVWPDAALTQALLRLMLLHRYCNLNFQLADCPGWQAAPDLPGLAQQLWAC